MLSGYSLVVNIICLDPTISEARFREKVALSLAYLDALQGALSRSPGTHSFLHDFYENGHDQQKYWQVRSVVLISLGKDRAKHLVELYKAISRLIDFELSEKFDATFAIDQIDFS